MSCTVHRCIAGHINLLESAVAERFPLHQVHGVDVRGQQLVRSPREAGPSAALRVAQLEHNA